ncbi:hypothetical protein Desca_1984 [Desulfotomaculum nigrificans CO-1-SRB]|uniref:Uncharacterized protein n=1 Tax=Desulfotomaculum nigrificans (strain DSM 14880 / VKM B-2319 / CO-1-SRB) TaxID=868595 RepID=F6B953_DESCC|nr:hypothetical protein [Desulfotomaculum nigrificans]AEF94825.1 hypothetical protein Desca_1984 [Desulfotomaculum nigrificans CO-1-SRB]
MLAVGFFFVLAGGIILFAGIMKLFLGQMFGPGPGQYRQTRKWVVVSAVGLICFILGLLMAMTA